MNYKKIKIVTLLGTRPEFIRLSQIIPKLDKYCNHTVIHTGQNYDYELNEIFFKELKIRKPDIFLDARGTFGNQLSIISKNLEKELKKIEPEKILILGDTNSSLGAIIAKRLKIPVFHMEAGNRCYDLKVPEEVNRKIIDHASDILMPYTKRSCENLVSEGIPRRRIYITGNPIFEVINKNKNSIKKSKILKSLKLKKNKYFLLTMHREENVDSTRSLKKYISSLVIINKTFKLPIIWPIHPRSKNKLSDNDQKNLSSNNIQLLNPLGFFDFITLEQNASCVLTDSGTVQEECSIFGIPNITLRDTTERPETIESGSNVVTSSNEESIISSINLSLENKNTIKPPEEYVSKDVSTKVCKIILGIHYLTYA